MVTLQRNYPYSPHTFATVATVLITFLGYTHACTNTHVEDARVTPSLPPAPSA